MMATRSVPNSAAPSDAAGITKQHRPRRLFDTNPSGGLYDLSSQQNQQHNNNNNQHNHSRTHSQQRQHNQSQQLQTPQNESNWNSSNLTPMNSSFFPPEVSSSTPYNANQNHHPRSNSNNSFRRNSNSSLHYNNFNNNNHDAQPRGAALTLRDQEKVIDATRKENFSLKLKIYFLDERLKKLTTEEIDKALNENIDLKVDISNAKQEVKKYKRLLLDAERAIGTLKSQGGDSQAIAELENEIERMKEEFEIERMGWKERLDKGYAGHGELDQLRRELDAERDAREEAEAERDKLLMDRDMVSNVARDKSIEELEEELNHYRDKLSSTLLELERAEHEREEIIQELEACEGDNESWRNNYDQLKQDLEACEADIEGWRNTYEQLKQEKDDMNDLLEIRNAELLDAQEKLAEMENYMNEDQDKLDEALRLLAIKDKDISSKEEEIRTQAEDIKNLGQQIVELEIDAKQLGVSENERNSAAQELVSAKREYNDLVKENDDLKGSLDERNALLLLIQGYLESSLEKQRSASPKKHVPAEVKTLEDFPVFSDNLMTRLKELGNLVPRFENRAQELENKFTKQLVSIRKSYDSRLRQLDRLETSMKNTGESQRQWRSRVVMKQGELDSVKSTNNELQAQITSLKSRVSSNNGEPGSASKINTLNAKASSTEKRLIATQKQLDDARDKLKDGQKKMDNAEQKWVARFQELENRLKQADEKVKRERLGAKERVNDLMENVKQLEHQLAEAQNRNKELDKLLQDKSQV